MINDTDNFDNMEKRETTVTCDENCLECKFPDCIRDHEKEQKEKNHLYYMTHRDEILKRRKEYVQKHHETILEKARKSRMENPEKWKEYRKRHAERHKGDPTYIERNREYQRKYREKKKNAGIG